MNNQKLNEIFGTEDDYSINDIQEVTIVPNMEPEEISRKDILQDVDYSRNNIKYFMEQSQKLVSLAIQKASEEDSRARDIEVATTALSSAVEIATKLVELQEKANKLLNNTLGENNTFSQTNNTNTFYCNTNDLLEVLKTSEVIKANNETKEEHIADDRNEKPTE